MAIVILITSAPCTVHILSPEKGCYRPEDKSVYLNFVSRLENILLCFPIILYFVQGKDVWSVNGSFRLIYLTGKKLIYCGET